MQYAFFAPYTLERHSDLVAELQMDERVRVESLGAHTVCQSTQVFALTCSWRITATLPTKHWLPVPTAMLGQSFNTPVTHPIGYYLMSIKLSSTTDNVRAGTHQGAHWMGTNWTCYALVSPVQAPRASVKYGS